MNILRNGGRCAMAVTLAAMTGGCTEEVQPPQTQTQPAAVEQGPITSYGSQGGGSALGGAKRAATNIIDQAQDQSERTARDFDDLTGGSSDE